MKSLIRQTRLSTPHSSLSTVAGLLAAILIVLVPAARPVPLAAQVEGADPYAGFLKALTFRNIGPANMMGRAADIAGIPGNPDIIYVAAATGGVWKTTNAGVTWTPIFDHEPTNSIGAIAVAPSDHNVIFVGTGEGNPRNSAGIGDGLYKSTDGGQTWTHLGLKATESIARIRIHPRDPDTVIVAALGHKWGPNDERGIFLTTDGGRTWKNSLFVNRDTGASDVEIDPTNPRIVYAGLYQFRRTAYSYTGGGPGSGVYRSTDGGASFKRVASGLPKGLMGRIGISAARSSPGTLYAMIETKNEGVLFRSDDFGENWRMINDDPQINGRPFYYTDVRADPNDANRLYSVMGTLLLSTDGGKTWERIGQGIHGDHQAFWIDPTDSKRVIDGSDGGFHVSHDGTKTWDYMNSFAVGQFYHVGFDMQKPYRVGGGLQDNGSWIGPSQTHHTLGILNDDWRRVGGGDGMYVLFDPLDPTIVYSNSQAGEIVRLNLASGSTKGVIPYPVSQAGGAAGDFPYRFNWNAPIVISPHDPKTLYLGGNVIFKSTDRGHSWSVISPDLTTNDKSRLGPSGGPITLDNSGAEFHCTILTIAESPLDPSVIWAGTDDGNVQVTRDGGKTWTNVVSKIAGLPPNSWVPMIDASRVGAGTAYVAFDRHRSDDMKPYAYKTTDYGQTWTPIRGNLPDFGYVWVVREDPKNRNLLYCGTELGLFVSFDGGGRWHRVTGNLPTVAVNDLLIHPRDNDLILGTHGRGIWILDDLTPLQQLSSEVLSADAYLFDIRPAVRFDFWNNKANVGQKYFVAPNPPYGALISYRLKTAPADEVVMTVQDRAGQRIREFQGTKEAGLNRVAWDLRYDGPTPAPEEPAGTVRGRRGGGEFGAPPRGPQVLPGDYTIKIRAAGRELSKTVRVELDPAIKISDADLQAQLSALLTLRDMTSAANLALARVESLTKQLRALSDTLGSAPRRPVTSSDGGHTGPEAAQATTGSEAILKSIEGLKAQLLDAKGRITRFGPDAGLTKRVQLRDKITSLASSIGGAMEAPTTAESELLVELQRDLKTELDRFNEIVTKSIPGLNGELTRANIPHVAPGPPIAVKP